ncbi:MAG: hypothetical protein Ta2F_10580 [Termitinemataceae bacterium]|nr:MAG: hypothetical protein Ta2F_10580 [Termitinemataceae bacterium]
MIHITKYLYGKKRMSFANIFFAVFFLFAASFTFAQDADSSSVAEDWFIGRKIKDIIFEGLKHIKASELDGVTDSYVGKTLTYDLFYELNGKIYALDYFEPDIKPTAVPVANDVIIRFIVKERPTISKIDFVGNSGLRRNELLNVISIKPNEIANQVKIRLDEQELIKKYLEKGYPDISVTSTTRTDKNGSVNLTFTVSEGVKITIDAIYFEGNSVFSQKTLANQLSLKTKVLFKSAAFQEAKLIADRESIIKFYHDRGYIDAEITDIIRDITHDAAGNHLALTFRLSEGERYTFGGIIFDGNHIFNEKEMQALVQSKKNEIINQSRLDQDFMRIMNKYTQNGYIFNTIDPEEHRDNVNRTVSYTVNIVERGRAHLENIIVTGNKKTKDYVILRELPLETGDIFSNTKITSGYSNLYNMQFFSSVLMDPRQGSAEGLMDLIINVEEQPTTDLQAGLTFSGSTDPDAFPISLQRYPAQAQ